MKYTRDDLNSAIGRFYPKGFTQGTKKEAILHCCAIIVLERHHQTDQDVEIIRAALKDYFGE